MSWLKKMALNIFDLGVLATFTILMYLIVWEQGGIRLSRQLLVLKSAQQQQLDKLHDENHQLMFKYKMLHEDEQYLDWEARSHWELVKPGEQVIWYHQLEEENAVD